MDSSYRVSQLVAGENHTLVLTDNGKLFAWGKGMFGRLGTGKNDDLNVPTEINLESQHTIISIAAGSYHSLALTDDGSIWSWGFNDLSMDGQLGYGDITDSGPSRIANWGKFEETPNGSIDHDVEGENSTAVSSACTTEISNFPKVIRVSAGGMMSCAIDESGVLWMWGNCPQPESEFIHMNICPKPVRSLQGLVVVKVACGSDHVIVVAEGQSREMAGQYVCYAWGSNKYGQLGLGDCKSRDLPEHIQALDGQTVGTVDQICCGAYHTAVLTHNDSGEHRQDVLFKRRSMCWTFGMGENGQLGHGTSQSLSSPKLVHGLPEDLKIVSIACGLFHTGVVTESGHIWTWGMEQGLGLCPGIGPPGVGAGDYMHPVRLQASKQFDDYHHEKLVCGAAHTVVSSNGGTCMFAWGRGLNGLLGTGQPVDSIIPLVVVWPPSDPSTVISEPIDTKVDHSSTSDSDMDKMLALAQKEICVLTTELAGIKEHMRLLHTSLYGTTEAGSGSDNMALQALDKMITNTSYDGLLQLDNFYRQARSRVKEVLLQKKVERLCQRFLQGSNPDGMEKVMHGFR